MREQGGEQIKVASLWDDITSGLEGFGKTALSIGGNVLLDLGVSFALQKAGEAWDNYSNKQENAIQKGNDALNDYKQTNQEMQSATSWVEENGERFTELSKKATQLGEQGKLTNSEFQEYNQLSAQAAEYFPKLVTGYNSENTPITSLGKSVNSLDDALSTEKLNRYAEAANSAKDVISKFKAEMYQDKTDITKESGITNQMDVISSFLDGYDSGKENPLEALSSAANSNDMKKATVNLNNLQEAMENAGIEKTGAWGLTYSKDDFTNPDNVQTLRNYYEDLQSQAENSVSAIKEVMPAFFQEQEDYQKLIGKNSNLDTEIGTMLTGLTQDSIERIIGGSVNDMSDDEVVAGIRNWSKKLVNNLQDQDTQDAFENLFSVNDNKDSLSFQDYEKKASNAVDTVAKKTSAFTKDELKQQSGITDSLDEMQTAYNNIADRFGKDEGFSEDYVKNQLSASDMLTLGTMATDDQYKDLSYNDALEKITVAKRQNELSVANLQKSVDTITSQYSTVSSAIQESMSDTGLTADSITAIKNSVKDVIDSSEELKDFDLDGLFTNTSKGVKLNNSQLENLLDIQNDIKEQDFAESIDQQTEALEKQTKEAEELKKQYGETSDEYVNALEKQKQAQEDLNATQQAQSQYYAQYQQQKQLFSDYADWQRATQTENSGDKYLSMVSGLETAKKAFDAGEVGTDDFKTFAKMISPSGSTDAANFAENYGKAARYLTEDESGLLNFFQDLSTKTDAAGEKMAKFNEETQSWELNVHDLGEIAQTLGTGEPLVEALFGRAEDYGATSTVISDMQDGILKSTEATKNWAEAKARLDRMNEENAQAQQEGKDPIYNTTAIQAAEDEVAKYQQQIDGLQESMDYYAEHNLGSEAQQKKIKTAADEISNIQQKMQEAEKNNNETLANAYRNLAKEKAAAAGITVDDDLNVTGNGKTAQEQLQEKSSSGSSSLSGTDFNYDKTSMTLDEIDSKINELQGKRATIDVDVEGEETVNALDTEISALEAQKIQVQIQTAVENGNSLQELLTLSDQELMTTVGCDASQVDAVRAEIQEMSGESVDLTVAMDSTQFVALINAITGETVEVPVEANTDGAVQETTSAIEGSNPKVTPEVDTSNVESQTQSAVQNAAQGATVELPTVDVKGNITSVEPYSGEVDVNAKANITGVVGGDNLNVVVNAKAHVTGSDGQTSEGTINYKKGNVEKADGTTSEGIINYKKGDVEKADGTVSTGIINYDLGNVATPTGMVATGVINYTLGSVAKPKAAGTFGQARAYAQGSLTDLSAYAGGRVALPKDEKALVNEVGTESIVRDGQWSLIPGGAHLENLKKGDIIFSASQTEDLLKRGATPGHARAYAQGSLSDLSPLSNAYSVGGLSLKFGGGLSNKTSVSSGSGSSQTDKAVQQAAKDVSSAAKSSSSSSSKQKEAIDYVEMKIDYITTKLNDYLARAERYNNYVNSNKEYAKAIKTIDELIAANKQASKTYEQKANSVALSEDIKTKVRTGAYEITEYDDATQKLITQYEKWWKKKVESDSNVNSLKEQKKDTAQKKFDSIKAYYENRRNYSASKVSTRQAELDYRENAGYSQFSGRQKYLYNQQYEQARYQYKTIKNEASAYQKQIAIQLKNGTLKKNSTEWFEAQQHLQELNQELYDSKNAMVDAKKELRQLPIKKLQYALDGLTRFGDKIKNILNLKTSRGQTISDKEYRTQAANINDQINNNYKTRQRLLKEQKNYEYGSTEWNDLADQIYECDNNIISLEQDLDDVKRSMLDMHFKPLDDFKDKVDQSITELDFLRNMLNEIKVDSKGNLTDAGYADIALIAQEMKLNKQTITEYTEGLKKLEASKDQFVSEDEYNEKWKEYTEIIRDAASANHDLTGELVDMYIDGLEKQNDALQDNIDKQIEALKKKKDYWDYDKNIRKQTSELQALRAQAAALEGVTDAASKAKLAKIKADIKDKQDDLDDTVRDHDIEFRTDSLNDFADEAKDTLDKLTENIKSSTEEQQKIVDAMLGTLTTNYDTAYKTINATIKNTGVVMSDTTSGMVSKLDSVTGAVGLVNDAMKSLAETMSEVAKNISTSFPNLSTDSNGKTTNKATNSANSMTDETNGNSNTNKNDSNVQASNTATSIKFKKKTVDGYVDTKVTLKYDITPKNATVMLQWKSSNTSAVTVSSKGVIVGKKAGSTAKITVTDTVSGKSDTCTVKVQKTIAVLEPADGKTNTSGSSGSSDIFKGLSKDTSNKGNNSLNKNVSIADSLAYLGYAPTLANQRLLYSNLKGSGTYTGTASQNTWLLQQLRKKGYANGTKNVPLDGLYEVGEEGSEIIVNKQGILLAGLEAGDGVIPHDLTQNLWQLATEGMPSRYNEPSTILDYVGSSGDVDNSVNTNNMNNVINITIEGNADSQTVEQLRGVAQSLLNDKKFVDGMIGKFDKKISKDASKAGMTRRIRS